MTLKVSWWIFEPERLNCILTIYSDAQKLFYDDQQDQLVSNDNHRIDLNYWKA